MSEEKREGTPNGEQDQENLQDSGLVDVFEEDEATRRFRVEDLAPKQPDGEQEEDNQLEERDYRPIRFRRDSRTGCLGGLMYAVFVISVSALVL